MKTKRLLRMFILVCLLPLSAMADIWQDPETEVNYEYSVDNGNAMVKAGSSWNNTLYAGSPDAKGDVKILPSFTVGGKEYTVTQISSLAFAGNKSITGISIPKTVKSIAGNAFMYCPEIEYMYVDSENKFFNSNGNAIISEQKITDANTIAIYQTVTLVAGCKNSNIPTTIDAIGSDAFRGCSGLKHISIPNNIVSIGMNAFQDCI